MSAITGSGVVRTSAIQGTTTNDNAAAGCIGEYVTSSVARASAITLTTNTTADVTSIALTAGDWDVSGMLGFYGNGGTITGTNFTASMNTVATTVGTLGINASESIIGANSAGSEYPPLTTWRVSVAAPTTVYLAARATFTGGTAKAFGSIAARRVR